MLKGIRVVDFTRYFPGPYATLRLEERGARVIKVEDQKGDPARQIEPLNGEEGCVFRVMNWGKKCVSCNLKDEKDRGRVLKIIEEADVLIESFRPGVTKRLGIDYETVKKRNPGLVYVSVTGYGQNTSLRNLAGHDLNYMAISGIMDQLTDPEGKPIKPQIALADLITGIAVSEAALTGLVKRLRTGEGCYQDIAMADPLVSFMSLHIAMVSVGGGEHGCNDHGIGYGFYETKDQRYVSLCAMEEKFFRNFCVAVGREDLIPHQAGTLSEDNPWYQEMKKIIRGRSLKEWMEFAEKTDCCMAPVLRAGELKASAFVRERRLVEHKWGMDYTSSLCREEDSFLPEGRPFSGVGEDN